MCFGKLFTLLFNDRMYFRRTWHQCMRAVRTFPVFLIHFPRASCRSGAHGVQKAHREPVSQVSSWHKSIIIHPTFFLSGLFHSKISSSISRNTCFVRRDGIETGEALWEAVVRVGGYFWVTIWLCLTLPMWMDEPDTVGFGRKDRGPQHSFYWMCGNEGLDTLIRMCRHALQPVDKFSRTGARKVHDS